jgi:hypothetical protein
VQRAGGVATLPTSICDSGSLGSGNSATGANLGILPVASGAIVPQGKFHYQCRDLPEALVRRLPSKMKVTLIGSRGIWLVTKATLILKENRWERLLVSP